MNDREAGEKAREDARQATLDALDREARERGADSYLSYIVRKFYDLSQAKKVLTAAHKGEITVEETDYDDAHTQLGATKELAHMGEAMYAPKEISGPGGGPIRVDINEMDPEIRAIAEKAVREYKDKQIDELRKRKKSGKSK